MPLERKSGMPSEVEMPAPVMRMMLLDLLMSSTASPTVLYRESLARRLSSLEIARDSRW